MRPFLILAALLGSIAAAHAFGLGHLGAGFGSLGAQGVGGPTAPLPTGKILLVDGVSHLLQVDAVSKVCLAGGC